MVFTNAGRQFTAWRLGSSLPDLYIQHIGIGDGSGTAAVTDATLVNEVDRIGFTTNPDFSTAYKATFQADFNTTRMSGVSLKEFGLFNVESGTGFPGSVWQREAFSEVIFDGTNELQILSTLFVSGV